MIGRRTTLNGGNITFFLLGCIATLSFLSIERFLSGSYSSSRYNLSTTTKKVAIVFGDSITQHGFNPQNEGWVAMLSHFWSRKVDVINRGFSGYNSRWGLSIIDDVVIKCDPHLVVIFFGANDAVVPEGNTFVPLSEFAANINEMITIVQQKLPLCSIVLIAPPPVGEIQLKEANIIKGKKIILDRSNERTMDYARACIRVGNKLKVPVLDAWSSLGGSSASRVEYLSDGLHLNSRGNRRLFEAFTSILESSLSQWMPNNLPTYMPNWTELSSAEHQDAS